VRLLAGEFVALTALSALGGAVVAALLIQNIVFVILIAAAGGMVPFFWLVWSRNKRQNLLVDQLADTLSILASSLRAGYSFLQALDTVSKEIGEPSASEFQRVVAEIRLGRPIDDALTAMAERVGSPDLKWAVIAVNVQREVGGNLAEVLDIVASTVRERAYIRRQVRVLSAEGRISVAILAALPFAIMLYLAIIRPEYLGLLFTTTIGVVMLVIGGVLMSAGIYIMTRIVKIDV
jgi:tight adherence protein B